MARVPSDHRQPGRCNEGVGHVGHGVHPLPRGGIEIDPELFDNWNTHIHVLEGAIPKDGPSAGITMITSLASVYTQRKVRANVAMTGEITLRGKVLPVGGIRKIWQPKRAGISDIILCKENQKILRRSKLTT